MKETEPEPPEDLFFGSGVVEDAEAATFGLGGPLFPPKRELRGPDAWRVAQTRYGHLLPAFPGRLAFPYWTIPLPPFLDPSWTEDEQILYLLRLYACATGLLYNTKYKSQLFVAKSQLRRCRSQVVLATRFFLGTYREGLTEVKPDGKRIVPQQIRPAMWVKWSVHTWHRLRPDTRVPLQWVFSRKRFQNPKQVNMFTHSADDLFRIPPVPTHAGPAAYTYYERMRVAVMEQGFRTEEELRTIIDKTFPKRTYKRLLKENAEELAHRDREAARLLPLGGWLWG